MAVKTLAIVIPAYKIDFFQNTLESLVNQTCQDFTVYIGNDNSTADFLSLVSKYTGRLDIVYHHFKENLGGRDLVGQWERCIALTQGEPWIWLFSDDDEMEERCVEFFVRAINSRNPYFDLFHFNVDVISAKGNVLSECKRFPSVINSEAFYKSKASAKLDSFVVEYIFSRDIYERTGGFVNFDLAWGSDIATWVRMGKEKGIYTIPNAKVFWRQSDKNITPDLNNSMVFRKAKIDIDFLCWINLYFDKESIRLFNKYALFRNIFHYSGILSKRQSSEILAMAYDNKVIGCFYHFILRFSYPLITLCKKLKDKL